MSVGYGAEAGFGIRLNIDLKTIAETKFDAVKQIIWSNIDESSRAYYQNDVENMFDESYFDMSTIEDAFSELRFAWCGNPYTTKPKTDQFFAVAKSTYVKIEDDAGYYDLSKNSKISSEAAQQLEQLRILAVDEEKPRWYVWLSIS